MSTLFSNTANLESILDWRAVNYAEMKHNRTELSCAEGSGADIVGCAEEEPCLCHSEGVDVEEGTCSY